MNRKSGFELGASGWILRLLGTGVLLVLVVMTAHAQDTGVNQGTGVIEGRVVNGTAGGPEVGAGIAVSLHTLRGQTEGPVLDTATDANGNFRFEGLDTDPTLEYWPEVVYLDVPYDSPDPYQFQEGEMALDAVLTVYETTEDDSAITLGSAHLIMESFGEMLRISEIHLYSNSGDRTFVGHKDEAGQRTTLFIPLPDSTVGLSFQEEPSADRYVEVEGGLWDTDPVPPGQETGLVFFSYHLAVTGNSMSLERHFAYPVNTLNILVAQPGLTLRSDQLQDMGPQSFQGRDYDFFVMQGLAPDMPLQMELLPSEVASSSGMPAAPESTDLTSSGGAAQGSQGVLRGLGFVLAALAVIGVLVYALSARRPAVAVVTPDLTANARSSRLLTELAELEDAYAAGQVDDTTYERERAGKYEALRVEVGR
jgi:hypothetical protein